MSSSNAPSLNQFCYATTAVPNSQLSNSQLIAQRGSTTLYFTQQALTPLQQQNTMYRSLFPSQSALTAYRKSQAIATGRKGPLLSQNAAVEILLLQNQSGCQ